MAKHNSKRRTQSQRTSVAAAHPTAPEDERAIELETATPADAVAANLEGEVLEERIAPLVIYPKLAGNHNITLLVG